MQYCADTCHGGANEQANATMDLSGLNLDPPDAACARVRARITPGDPDGSQILIVTDPTQQVVHMYKFMGNKNKYSAFKTAVSPWILSGAMKRDLCLVSLAVAIAAMGAYKDDPNSLLQTGGNSGTAGCPPTGKRRRGRRRRPAVTAAPAPETMSTTGEGGNTPVQDPVLAA
ncbi:MAG: hypothetical protein R3B70_30320 [Polyangiaceae bacterium]